MALYFSWTDKRNYVYSCHLERKNEQEDKKFEQYHPDQRRAEKYTCDICYVYITHGTFLSTDMKMAMSYYTKFSLLLFSVSQLSVS
jgi:Pyruvate/2-oxoacid:ferredoxin oxidoreductase delta subunit